VKAIRIADQPKPSFPRTVRITIEGIRYRLFRASVTVAVIAMAVAFLFYTESDGGTKLFLGKGLAVNNDGGHAMVEKSGKVSLAEGLCPIRVEYFEGGGGEGLKVSYEGPGIEKQAIPASALFSDK